MTLAIRPTLANSSGQTQFDPTYVSDVVNQLKIHKHNYSLINMVWNFGKPILQYCSIFKEKTKKIQPKICIKFFKLPGILARLRQSLCKSNFSNFCPSSNSLQFTNCLSNDFSLHVVCNGLELGWFSYIPNSTICLF